MDSTRPIGYGECPDYTGIDIVADCAENSTHFDCPQLLVVSPEHLKYTLQLRESK
jgi:hypothetical protein